MTDQTSACTRPTFASFISRTTCWPLSMRTNLISTPGTCAWKARMSGRTIWSTMSVVYQSAWPSLRAASTSAASGRYGSAACAGSRLNNRRAARSARTMVLPRPSAEQIVIDLGPTRRLGLEIVRRIDHRLVAALLRLELGDAGRHVRVHRHIVVVAEDLLSALRRHEVDEQPRRVGVHATFGHACDLQRLAYRIERHPFDRRA